MDRFLGLRRTLNGIVAVYSTVTSKICDAAPDLTLRPYSILEKPLNIVDEKDCPEKQRILQAWEALASVQTLNAQVLTDCLIVIMDTRPEIGDERLALALTAITDNKKEIKASAAHPRAYKGTKTKPPKVSTPYYNLQSLICTTGGSNYLLDQLDQYRKKTLAQKSQNSAISLPDKLASSENLHDIYYYRHFKDFDAKQMIKISPAFGRLILPCVSGYKWKTVIKLAEICRALDLDQDENLAATLARMASYKPVYGLLDWCEILASRRAAQRLPLIIVFIITHSLALDPAQIKQYLIQLDALSNEDTDIIAGMFTILDGVHQKHNMQYIFDGLHIASELGHFLDLGKIEKSYPAFDKTMVMQIQTEIFNKDKSRSRWPNALSLWRNCGTNQYLNQSLPYLINANLEIETAKEAIYFLLQDFYFDSEPIKIKEQKKKLVGKFGPTFLMAIASIPPPYKERHLQEVKDFFYYYEGVDSIEKDFTGLLTFLKRICAPPFSPDLEIIGTAIGLIERYGIKVLVAADDASLLAIEAQSKNGNMQGLVRLGLSTLVEAQEQFVWRCFKKHTSKLCKVAKVFSTLNSVQKNKLIKLFAEDPIMQDLSAMDLFSLYALFKPHLRHGINSPFSAKVARALRGEIELSNNQWERGREQVINNLDDTRLDILRSRIFTELKSVLPQNNADEKTLHALQLFNRSRYNRRAFKSFMRNYWNGKSTYRQDHILSKRWLNKHPSLDIETFSRGIVMENQIDDLGTVTISVEQDPLEALKLGTYANTCLSINGMCNDSSLAVVLDINKLVLYARDESGKVLGRQLVCWSEADELVCFNIYPLTVSRSLKLFFHAYDLAFASALDTVARYENYDENDRKDPVIVNILSESWWDDGAWDISELEDEMVAEAAKSGTFQP